MKTRICNWDIHNPIHYELHYFTHLIVTSLVLFYRVYLLFRFIKVECSKPFPSPLESHGSLMQPAAMRLVRDPSVMGTQKSDCQKAAHIFFLRAHFLQKKIMGEAPIMRSYIFLCNAQFLKKKLLAGRPLKRPYFFLHPHFLKKKL